MRNLKTVMEELDISYTLPVQPVLLPKNTPFGGGASVSSRPGSIQEQYGSFTSGLGGYARSADGGLAPSIRIGPGY